MSFSLLPTLFCVCKIIFLNLARLWEKFILVNFASTCKIILLDLEKKIVKQILVRAYKIDRSCKILPSILQEFVLGIMLIFIQINEGIFWSFNTVVRPNLSPYSFRTIRTVTFYTNRTVTFFLLLIFAKQNLFKISIIYF